MRATAMLYILGALFTIAFAFPLFWMLESKSTALIFAAIIIAMNFGHGMMFAPESCYFPELFGPNVRYSGASFGFQVSAAIGGGFAPIIATAMVGYLGGTAGVSLMMMALALITLGVMLRKRRVARSVMQPRIRREIYRAGVALGVADRLLRDPEEDRRHIRGQVEVFRYVERGREAAAGQRGQQIAEGGCEALGVQVRRVDLDQE